MNEKKEEKGKFYLDCKDDGRWIMKHSESESFEQIMGKGVTKKKEAQAIIDWYNKEDRYHHFIKKGSKFLIEIEFTKDVMRSVNSITGSVYSNKDDEDRIIAGEFRVVVMHFTDYAGFKENIKNNLTEAIDKSI